jgi:tetratricopeptide (TPR) repeat protein
LRLDPLRRLMPLAAASALGVFAVPHCAIALQAQATQSKPAPPVDSVPVDSIPISALSTPQDVSPVEVADTLMYHKRYQEAIAKYTSVEPKTAELWNKMGIAYQLMLNPNDAARCYRESIKLNPKDPSVFNNLGTVYESELDHRSAGKMYRKAIELNPDFALGYKNLATSLMAQHKYKQGRAADARALAIDPNILDPGNYLTVDNPASARDRGAMNYFMAVDCARAGQTACALEHLRMALNQGYTSANKIAADSNFAALASDPAFQALLAEQRGSRK